MAFHGCRLWTAVLCGSWINPSVLEKYLVVHLLQVSILVVYSRTEITPYSSMAHEQMGADPQLNRCCLLLCSSIMEFENPSFFWSNLMPSLHLKLFRFVLDLFKVFFFFFPQVKFCFCIQVLVWPLCLILRSDYLTKASEPLTYSFGNRIGSLLLNATSFLAFSLFLWRDCYLETG